jgi:hypothetical protein
MITKSNESQKKVVREIFHLKKKSPNTRANPSLVGIIKNYFTKIQGKVYEI